MVIIFSGYGCLVWWLGRLWLSMCVVFDVLVGVWLVGFGFVFLGNCFVIFGSFFL